MPSIKLKIEMKDKKNLFPLRGTYDPDTRILKVQRSLRQTFPTNYKVDPDHIYFRIKGTRTEKIVYIDNATRASIPLEQAGAQQNQDIDGKTKNTLDYLIEEKFWKSLIAKSKLPLSTLIIVLCAGGGIFYIIRDIILPIFGVAT